MQKHGSSSEQITRLDPGDCADISDAGRQHRATLVVVRHRQLTVPCGCKATASTIGSQHSLARHALRWPAEVYAYAR
jgi:hypothetical protein